jgi:hypothetical protein
VPGIADHIVDALMDRMLAGKVGKSLPKYGFFTGPVPLCRPAPGKTFKRLVTEREIADMVSEGKKSFKKESGCIITPSARLLMEEKGIREI